MLTWLGWAIQLPRYTHEDWAPLAKLCVVLEHGQGELAVLLVAAHEQATKVRREKRMDSWCRSAPASEGY